MFEVPHVGPVQASSQGQFWLKVTTVLTAIPPAVVLLWTLSTLLQEGIQSYVVFYLASDLPYFIIYGILAVVRVRTVWGGLKPRRSDSVLYWLVSIVFAFQLASVFLMPMLFM